MAHKKGSKKAKKGKKKSGMSKAERKRRAAARKAAKTRAAKAAARSRAAKKAAKTRAKKGKRKSPAKKKHAKKKHAARAAETPKKKGKKKGGKKKGSKKAKKAKKSSSRRPRPCTPKMVAATQKRSAARKNREVEKLVKQKIANDKRHERTQKELQSKYDRLEKRYKDQAAERRHRRGKGKKKGRKGSSRRRGMLARMPNPLRGAVDFVGGVTGVVIGVVLQRGADRYYATHALQSSTTGNTTTFTDAPGAGQVYDTAGPSTPIWSSWKRMVAAVVTVSVPLGIAAFIPANHAFWKSFLQLIGLGALGGVGAKAAEDGLAKALKSRSIGLRLYAPEVAAQAELTTAQGGILPGGKDPTAFAGLPEGTPQRPANDLATRKTPPAAPPKRVGQTPAPAPSSAGGGQPPSPAPQGGGPGPTPGGGSMPNGQPPSPAPIVECVDEDSPFPEDASMFDGLPNEGPKRERPAA